MTLAIAADGLAYHPIQPLADEDEVMLAFRASDPEVLERDVNPAGGAQASTGKGLVGFRIAGSGMGGQFMVSLVFSEYFPHLGGFVPPAGDDGLRLFFFKGATPEALAAEYEKARQRIEAWAPNASWLREIHGWETGGGSDGGPYMGCVAVYRAAF